jgi:hypothetical protein
VFYGIGQARLHPHWPARLLWLPLLTLGSLGLAAANSRAILEALTGWKSPFVRTPKAGDAAAFHYRVKFPIPPLMEVGIGIYALAGAILAWHASQPGLTQFGLLTSASFLFVGLGSLRESLPAQKPELSAENPDPNIELASQ